MTLRLPFFALLTFLAPIGCGDPEETGEPADADTDTDADGDTDADTDADADTSYVLAWFEGSADIGPGAWTGQESFVVYDISGSEEYCRVTNPNAGTPSDVPCPDCSFVFDLVWESGSMTGDKCAGTGLSANLYDGQAWTYGYDPDYTYTYNGTDYSYGPVIVLAYEGYTSYGLYAYFAATANADESHVDYEAFYPGYAYYYN